MSKNIQHPILSSVAHLNVNRHGEFNILEYDHLCVLHGHVFDSIFCIL